MGIDSLVQLIRDEQAAAAIVGPNRLVQLVRKAGSPEEKRRVTRMGGDFVTSALVLASDQPEIRDEIHGWTSDEPFVISKIDPVVVQHGLSHWIVSITPRSEWRLLHDRRELPNTPAHGIVRPYPRTMYHATLPAVTVHSSQEESALGPDWSRAYISQSYPKNKYHWSGKTALLKSLDEEIALGGGWANTPAAFDRYKDPAKARPKELDPIKWVGRWRLAISSPELEKAIEAAVHRADAVFWKSGVYPTATAESMRFAYKGIAHVLFDSGILDESMLTTDIPELVLDSAIAGGWWHLASETPQAIFPEQIGHYWVWRDQSWDWANLFRSEVGEWRAKLCEVSPGNGGRTEPIAPSEVSGNVQPEPGAARLEIPSAGSNEPVTPTLSSSKMAQRYAPEAPSERAVNIPPELPDGEQPLKKGKLSILRGVDGQLKRAVTLDIASQYGGVSRRAIEDAAKKGRLKTEGERTNRRVLVDSLLEYFPPEE
jgi:hypothetical protein